MITFMSDIICVTNRNICTEDFLTRIERIAGARPGGIILREKDLCEDTYKILAEQVLAICKKHETPCTLHTFINSAARLGADRIHLPLHVLRNMDDREKSKFSIIGASCHSPKEAVEAEMLGCNYITAGHVFNTDCKKGMPGRGLAFLRQVCDSVAIPVYAIGGIDSFNYNDVCKAGAAGACIMGSFMQCRNVKKFMEGFTCGNEI